MTQKVKEKLEYCNNNLSDDVIIETFVSKTKCGNFRPNVTYTKYIYNYPNIINYIFNRYTNEEKNINEILYRILHNINILPVCKECGKPVKFISFFSGYQTFCCIHCIRINKDTNEKRRKTCFEKYGSEIYVNIEKAKLTCKEKYGVENVSQTNEHKEKVKLTNLKKYGVTCAFLAEQIKYKTKQTNLERYGVEYSSQNKEIKEKAMQTNLKRYGQKSFNKEKTKQTNLERYGVENSMQVEEIKLKLQNTMVERYGLPTSWNHGILREKQYLTCIEKYGVKQYAQTDEFKLWNSEHMKSPEIQKKILETKRKNNSFHSSKLELEFKNYLELKYINDVEFQYKSELYPFNCDFYIKSLDLYIEIQGDWRHGFHPFDENNLEDINRLEKLKALEYEKLIINKQHKTDYTNAIITWTIRDPQKRKYTQDNNLNYLEIFSNNINEAIQIFEKYINNLNN